MKFLILLLIACNTIVYSQCNIYQIYESFGSGALPTQGGTWSSTSMTFGTVSRTGANGLTLNGAGDIIRTPIIANPSVFSFYYRRSSTATGTPQFIIETSTNGSTWTNRGSITTFSTNWTLYSLNIGALSLTNVYVRVRDARASGAAERYIDDMAWTSTIESENTLIPFLSNCSQTLNTSIVYTITDIGGLNEKYNNNMNQVVTLTPSNPNGQLTLSFSVFNCETSYDYLYVYDGASTSSTLLQSLNGNSLPLDISSDNSNGQLTLAFSSDISNTRAGFSATVTFQENTGLPIELLYFEGKAFPSFNNLKWSTASEMNSDYFTIEESLDGIDWKSVGIKSGAGNSNQVLSYSYSVPFSSFNYHYYRLKQTDYDGNFKYYGPISIDNTRTNKKIVKYVNILGQEISPNTEAFGLIFEIYEDGTFRKVLR